ncbi:MAG: metalloregulator ArsR/SmtB family transcription factor [Chloroflexota bacterium]|nr:MAG: metalloregulator ArsR/SmtB family transcription factor [Chloroflexota bacterium]
MSDQETIPNEFLDFFKAMADANRLRILGLLAQENLTVEQLSEMLNLRPSTVSHHLAKLAEVGLVSAKASSYYNIYQLENKELEKMAQRLLSGETLPAMAADVNLDAYDQKVVSNYLNKDGRLKTIPSQRKKLEAILRYIAQNFSPGERYSEGEVNQILSQFHQDTASLRREMIGIGLLERSRDGREYWLAEEVS